MNTTQNTDRSLAKAKEERQRLVVRRRGTVLKERNRWVLRGHGMMLAQGVRAPANWWRPLDWLHFGAELPGWLREQVGLWQAKALSFEKELKALTGKVEALSDGKQIPKGLGSRASPARSGGERPRRTCQRLAARTRLMGGYAPPNPAPLAVEAFGWNRRGASRSVKTRYLERFLLNLKQGVV